MSSERPHEPEAPVSNHDTQDNLLQVPWADVMESIESNMDTSHIAAGQEALSRRISMIEDGAWTERDALMREQQRVAETHRENQTKVDLCLARLERLTN